MGREEEREERLSLSKGTKDLIICGIFFFCFCFFFFLFNDENVTPKWEWDETWAECKKRTGAKGKKVALREEASVK